MAPKLYIDKLSPPCRAVWMCAQAINLDLDVIEISLTKGDHLKPDFVKLNPLHTVPTLDNDGFVLHDSHAIMAYLIDKYAKDKSLYPEEVHKRAIINQRLYFDSGILFPRHINVIGPIFLKKMTEVDEEQANAVKEAFGFVETFLKGSKYIAGDSLSIADLSIINSITNASALVPLDEATHPNIVAWRNLLKSLPYFEINQVFGKQFKTLMLSLLPT